MSIFLHGDTKYVIKKLDHIDTGAKLLYSKEESLDNKDLVYERIMENINELRDNIKQQTNKFTWKELECDDPNHFGYHRIRDKERNDLIEEMSRRRKRGQIVSAKMLCDYIHMLLGKVLKDDKSEETYKRILYKEIDEIVRIPLSEEDS